MIKNAVMERDLLWFIGDLSVKFVAYFLADSILILILKRCLYLSIALRTSSIYKIVVHFDLQLFSRNFYNMIRLQLTSVALLIGVTLCLRDVTRAATLTGRASFFLTTQVDKERETRKDSSSSLSSSLAAAADDK